MTYRFSDWTMMFSDSEPWGSVSSNSLMIGFYKNVASCNLNDIRCIDNSASAIGPW